MTTFFDPSKVAGLPERYADDVRLMLERWAAVESRNRELGTYFDMKTGLKAVSYTHLTLPTKA